MNMKHLQLQRGELLRRIAQQRGQVEVLAQSLKSPAHFYDQGHALALKVKRHPLAVSLGGALFSLLVFRRLPLRKLGAAALLSLIKSWRASR